MVPATAVQSSPERAGGHRRLFTSAPRSLQLQPRPDPDPRPSIDRRRNAHAARRRGKGWRHDALRRPVRRLVEWRHQEHRDLSQHHRNAHGDHRQSHADEDPARARTADSIERPRDADRSAGVALSSIDRVLDLARSRGARLCLAHAREPALQHLRDGAELHRAREPRLLDGESTTRRRDRRIAWQRGRRGEVGRDEGPRAARCAWIHHSRRPARLSDGHQVRECTARDRHHRRARDEAL